MPFLAFSYANIEFTELKKLIQRFYITVEVLPTTSWVELIDKKEFIKTALDENSKTSVVYIIVLKAKALIHLSPTAQKAALQQDKAPTKILIEYSSYTDVFSLNLAMELPENTRINEHAIKLIDGK